MKIDSLIEDAMAGADVPSLRQLAKFAGVDPSGLARCVKGEGYPRPEVMVNLCTLAGRDPRLGLVYLGYWKSEGMVKKTYGDLIAELEKATMSVAAE